MSKKGTEAERFMNNLWWVTSIGLITLGAFSFKQSWWATIPLVLTGVAVFPNVFSRIIERLNVRDRINLRIPFVMVVLLGSTFLFGTQVIHRINAEKAEQARIEQETRARLEAERRAREEKEKAEAIADFNANAEQILAQINKALDAKNLTEAAKLISKYKKHVTDMRFVALAAKYDAAVEEVKREQQIAELLAQARKLGVEQYAEGVTIYEKLAALDPRNAEYKKKAERYAKLKAEAEERAAKAKAEAAAKEARKKLIEKQFSGWDGSHYRFERLIKQAMNDPDSYEHVETRYLDMGSHIRVYCTFRGRNAFGGMVKNTKVADFDINGNFIREVQ